MLLNPCGQPKKRIFLQSCKFVALRLLNDISRDCQRVDSVVVFINLNFNVNVNYVVNLGSQTQAPPSFPTRSIQGVEEAI